MFETKKKKIINSTCNFQIDKMIMDFVNGINFLESKVEKWMAEKRTTADGTIWTVPKTKTKEGEEEKSPCKQKYLKLN